MCTPRAMIRAHLLRSIGGGQSPLRCLPQESVARAKPALEPEHSTVGRANSHPLLAFRRRSVPLSSAGFAGATNPGGRFRKGGEAPLRAEVREIAQTKLVDLNTDSIESAMRTVEGTARSMGIEVV